MVGQVMELVRRAGGGGEDEETLRMVCQSACQTLDRRLRPGVTAQDCGGAYPLAAAWIALDRLRTGQGWSGVTALSAGDMTVRREAGDGGALARKAMELMAPWLRDEGFVFLGVKG